MTTVPSATNTPSTTSSTSNSAMSQLSGNFDTFLQLLTTQLQNQDPTSPMDTNQFTQQLVEYSQVEQQINTNSYLQNLISLQESQQNTQAVSYIGKNVTLTNGTGVLSNGAAQWTYQLPSAAASTTLTVKDASGNTVYSTTGQTAAGTYNFAWNGKDSNGNQLPDGSYTLSVSSTASDGSAVNTNTAFTGTVTQADLSASPPKLMIGSAEFPLSDVSAVAN